MLQFKVSQCEGSQAQLEMRDDGMLVGLIDISANVSPSVVIRVEREDEAATGPVVVTIP